MKLLYILQEIEDSAAKLPLPGDDENEMKIRRLEEQLETLENEMTFIKDRESMYQKKIQVSENKRESLVNELNSTKFELQKQETRAEKAEKQAAERSEELDINNENAVKQLDSIIRALQVRRQDENVRTQI